MRIREIALKELGFREEGFAYFRQELQVTQLRLSSDGKRTLIWHGATQVAELHRQFASAVSDLSYVLNVPTRDLNAYTALYGGVEGTKKLSVFLRPDSEEASRYNRAHQLFLVNSEGKTTFARLDLDSTIPVSLYSTITGRRATREIAFLGPVVPEVILSFFKKSSDVRLNDAEISDLFELLGPKITDFIIDSR